MMFTTLREAANEYAAVRRERIDCAKHVEDLKAKEKAIEEWIVANGGNKAIIGNTCRLEIMEGSKLRLADFDTFWSYLVRHNRNGSNELIYHRMREDNVTEWMAKGKTIDGVVVDAHKFLSYRSR